METALEVRIATTPGARSRPDVRLAPAAPSLWRVVDAQGRVIGHLQQVRESGGIRFRARRFHAPSRAFRDLGEFWRADDAIECLRFTR